MNCATTYLSFCVSIWHAIESYIGGNHANRAQGPARGNDASSGLKECLHDSMIHDLLWMSSSSFVLLKKVSFHWIFMKPLLMGQPNDGQTLLLGHKDASKIFSDLSIAFLNFHLLKNIGFPRFLSWTNRLMDQWTNRQTPSYKDASKKTLSHEIHISGIESSNMVCKHLKGYRPTC